MKLIDLIKKLREYKVNISVNKRNFIIYCVSFWLIFAVGYFSRLPSEIVRERVVMEKCSDNILKNKEGLSGWLYGKTRHMSIRQCEEAVEVAFEGSDPFIVLAIIVYEAGGDDKFVSSAGAIGHGGIMANNFESLKLAGIIRNDVRELFEPDVNIRATQFMFRQKYNMAIKDKNKPKDWSTIAWTMRLYRGWNRSSPSAMKRDLINLTNYTNKILNAYWELKDINRGGL